MKTFILPSFWSDRDVEGLSPEQKLTLLWIFTNPQMNVCGYFETSPKRFSFDTGLDPRHLKETVEALPRALKPFQGDTIIYARRFIRHQFGGGEQLTKNNIFKSIVTRFGGIQIPGLKAAILEDYPEIDKESQENESPSKPFQGLIEGKGKGKGKVRVKEREGNAEPTIPEALDTPEFMDAWARWGRYRTEKGGKFTPSTKEAQIKRLNLAGPSTAIAMIERSIQNGWTGLFELDGKNVIPIPSSQLRSTMTNVPGSDEDSTADFRNRLLAATND